MSYFNDFQFQIVFQLILAFVLGALVGLEREYKKKGAGLQTYSLVSLGSCLFAIIGLELFNFYLLRYSINLDPFRVIQAVGIGIGFIGAGVIFQRPEKIEGLTTAAGLWVTAAIGLAVGFKFYFLASLTTILAIVILVVLGALERELFKKGSSKKKKRK